MFPPLGPRRATRLALLLAVGTIAVGLQFGAFVAGGSDSYGYVSQAALWRKGRALEPRPVRLQRAPWPGADRSQVPLGYALAPSRNAAVPQYPPGLPLLMALAGFAGDTAVYFVVPLLGGVSVWLTWLLGRALLEGTWTPLAAAALLASSPTFLGHLLQPMSDVPATAAWLAALVVLRRTSTPAAFLAGVATGASVLIRPALAPLAVVAAAWLLVTGLRQEPQGHAGGVVRAIVFALGVVPAVAFLAWVQFMLYGSPLRSGYGPGELLFSADHVAPNLARYAAWLVAAHSPFILFWLAAPFAARAWSTNARALAGLLVASVLANVAVYLAYLPFESWTYTRFLLPSLPAMLVLGLLVLESLAPRRPRALAAAAIVAVLAWHVAGAGARDLLDVRRAEERYPRFGNLATAVTRPNASILSLQHSGSLRWYANRHTIRWDLVEPDWLERTVDYLHAQGIEPWAGLERWEAEAFRARFANATPLGRLDWQPTACEGDVCLYYLPPADALVKSADAANAAPAR